MQEQHENNTELESNFEALFEEAKASSVYIPNWVNKPFQTLYKFAYLQVKNDQGCAGMSSANREKLIKGLMEMYYKKIVESSETVQTGLAVESVSDKKVEGNDNGQSESVS